MTRLHLISKQMHRRKMQLQEVEITSSCGHWAEHGRLSMFWNVFLIISRTVFYFPYSTLSVLYEISKLNPLKKFSGQENEVVHQNLDRTDFTGSNFVASRNWIVIMKIVAHLVVTKVWHCIFGNKDPNNLISEGLVMKCYVEIQFTIKNWIIATSPHQRALQM